MFASALQRCGVTPRTRESMCFESSLPVDAVGSFRREIVLGIVGEGEEVGVKWWVQAMAMAVAVGASVDVSSGVRGGAQFVGGRGLRQELGFGPAVAAFPRGLGSYEVNLKCLRRPQRLTVRASNKGGPEFDDKNKNEGEKGSVDWDKAWESFPKPKKRNPFNLFALFNMDMEQHVNRRPTHSNYPLSEETDPLRKTERRALDAWTDSKFTIAGLGVVVGLFMYMVVVGPPPS